MTVRPFDWRDLPVLLRYRNDGLFFDTAQLLTRGTALTPTGAMLSYFAPATGVFTYLSDGDSALPLIGQVVHPSGSAFARLTFLTPKAALESIALSVLLEPMIIAIGERGALHLLAEADEHTVAFEGLRRAGFAIYTRQRVWQMGNAETDKADPSPWRAARERDAFAVRGLYHNLVPGLVQQAEPPPGDHLRGVVYRQGDELWAYVELRYGPRGIWAQPFIHPDAAEVPPHLSKLLQNLPNRRSRPVYLCVRSYQSWLETSLSEMGAQPGPLQAVMVKHLAVARKPARAFVLRPIEAGKPEPTTPFARVDIQDKK